MHWSLYEMSDFRSYFVVTKSTIPKLVTILIAKEKRLVNYTKLDRGGILKLNQSMLNSIQPIGD